MKDCAEEHLKSVRPCTGARDCVQFCLTRLYADQEHSIEEDVVAGLTYEELIGALLAATDEMDNCDDCINALTMF